MELYAAQVIIHIIMDKNKTFSLEISLAYACIKFWVSSTKYHTSPLAVSSMFTILESVPDINCSVAGDIAQRKSLGQEHGENLQFSPSEANERPDKELGQGCGLTAGGILERGVKN